MPELEIQLFGELRVRSEDRTLAVPRAPRQQALLAWLLLHADAPQPRKVMAFTFWPDSSEAQALTNLRRELHHLRRGLSLAASHLEVTPQTVCWRMGESSGLDVARFGQALESARSSSDPQRRRACLERAASLYRGDLLCTLDDDWLEPSRQELHERAVEALEQLCSLLERQGETTTALLHAQRLLRLEPLHESVYARLMRLHLAQGDRAAALHIHDQCARRLRTELGTTPGPAVQAMYRRAQDNGDAPPPGVPDRLPLIGRRGEWRQLLAVWRDVRAGASRALLVTGEAGIGKTRLAEALLAQAEAEGACTARTRSYAAEGRLAYAPVTDWLRSPALQPHLAGLAGPWRVEVARLLPELWTGDLPAPPPLSEGWQRQRLFEALARVFRLPGRPLLLLLDDLQWCDRDTLEWLHYLLRSQPGGPLLLVCTLRSEEQGDNPAVGDFLRDLGQHGLIQATPLGPLTREESGALAASVLEGELPPETQRQLFEATEGHPLFIVEALRAGLAPGAGEDSRWTFPPSPRVQAVIAARLAQLSGAARGVAQLAATVGRAFDAEVLREAGDLEEDILARALDELWRRSIIREQPGPGGAYDFSHDRLREGAYDELSPARRRWLHRRVARALESRHASDPGAVAAQLAAHHEQAGQMERAVAFSLRAVERANDVSANQEATRLAQRALALIHQLPGGRARDEQELALLQSLAAALSALKGYSPPELETILNRALVLAEGLGNEATITRSIWGLYALQITRGNLPLARPLAEKALRLAGQDTGLLVDGHHALGGVNLTEGHLAEASAQFAISNRYYRQHRHRRMPLGADVGVFSLSWEAHGLWLQGKVGQARERVAQAEAMAAEVDHPFSQMQARAYRIISHQLEHDLNATWETAEAVMAGGESGHFLYYREWGVVLGGWVLAQRGAVAEGITRMERGLAALRRLDAFLRHPYYLALLAESLLLGGQPEAARAALDEGQAIAERNGDLWYLPELHRLRGLTGVDDPEACFRRALALARGQGSLSLELRAATSLAAHLRERGRVREAAALLEPIHARFPRELVTHDLTLARELLGELS